MFSYGSLENFSWTQEECRLNLDWFDSDQRLTKQLHLAMTKVVLELYGTNSKSMLSYFPTVAGTVFDQSRMCDSKSFVTADCRRQPKNAGLPLFYMNPMYLAGFMSNSSHIAGTKNDPLENPYHFLMKTSFAVYFCFLPLLGL